MANFTYIPIRNRSGRAAIVISALLLLCTVLCVCFNAMNLGMRMPIQLAGAVSLIAGIYITGRYVLTSYKYVLNRPEDIDRFSEFIVIKIQGDKSKKVCNLSTATAVDIVKKTKIAEIEEKYGKISRKFNYCTNMFPDKSYYYIFEFNGVNNIIEFEASDEFLSTFNTLIGKLG